ncbi:MAG: response regulator, partial [Anaerolineales bacterium]|nr:response regulator [Anaerolineales bacterium]
MSNLFRILLVDDDRHILRTLADILTLQGYQVSQVTSAKEALTLLEQESFDCMITDISMPVMNGIELLQYIQKKYPGLPVFLMTAYASRETIRQGLESGAIAILEKPLDIQALLKFLASLCEENVIAILDDEPGFCATLADILEQQGFRTAILNDPHANLKESLQKAQILLLDMKLNAVNGLEVLKEVRQSYPNLPVILITGYREEMANAINAALMLNPCICFYKPLVLTELLERLREIRKARVKELWQVTNRL